MSIEVGSRVVWNERGRRSFGKITALSRKKFRATNNVNGQVLLLAKPGDEMFEIKSESTGNTLLKLRSELKEAPLKR
jgi:hypothetical protein